MDTCLDTLLFGPKCRAGIVHHPGEGGAILMAVQLCYICAHNYPKDTSEQAPSYDDCARCKRPTCTKHGRTEDADRFYCVRCLAEMGR